MAPEPKKDWEKTMRLGMGVPSLFDSWPFPNFQSRAKPGSLEAALGLNPNS